MSLLDLLFRIVLGFGIIGVFILAFLDSTIFFYLPAALDFLLIIFISRHRPWMPYYALVATLGSLAGCAFTYHIISKMSDKTLEKRIHSEKFEKVKKKLKRNGFAGLLIAALMPPPFPFTPFVIAAALSDLPRKRTLSAVAVGRALRYFILGALALLFGRHILRLLESPMFKLAMLGVFALAIIGSIITIFKWVRR